MPRSHKNFESQPAVLADHCLRSDPTFLPWFIITCCRFVHRASKISFSGAVWTTRPHFQVLTLTLPLFWQLTGAALYESLARHFGAFKAAIQTLEECYGVPKHSALLEILDPRHPDLSSHVPLPRDRNHWTWSTSIQRHSKARSFGAITIWAHFSCTAWEYRGTNLMHILSPCSYFPQEPVILWQQSLIDGTRNSRCLMGVW